MKQSTKRMLDQVRITQGVMQLVRSRDTYDGKKLTCVRGGRSLAPDALVDLAGSVIKDAEGLFHVEVLDRMPQKAMFWRVHVITCAGQPVDLTLPIEGAWANDLYEETVVMLNRLGVLHAYGLPAWARYEVLKAQ